MITVIKPGKRSKENYFIGKCWWCEAHDFEELPKYKYDKLLRKAKRRNNNECSCSKRREVRKPRR